MEVCVDSVQSALNAERGGEWCLSAFAKDSTRMKSCLEAAAYLLPCLNAFSVNECYTAISLLRQLGMIFS